MLPRAITLKRQREPEGAAFAGRAGNADGAAMPLDDVLADIEPQPQANTGTALLLDAWRAVEALEEVLLLLGREARPLVAHLHPHHIALDAHRDGDLGVVRRVFECVGQQ